MTGFSEIEIGPIDALPDPGCREFQIGGGDWPFRGFVVRRGDTVVAYQNYCMHAGHPLNWKPDSFLTPGNDAIICASHGALYDIGSGDCIGGPCHDKSLRPVDVTVRNGVIFVRGPVSA